MLCELSVKWNKWSAIDLSPGPLDLFLSPLFLVYLLAASVCVPVCEKQLHANTQAHIHTHSISEQI